MSRASGVSRESDDPTEIQSTQGKLRTRTLHLVPVHNPGRVAQTNLHMPSCTSTSLSLRLTNESPESANSWCASICLKGRIEYERLPLLPSRLADVLQADALFEADFGQLSACKESRTTFLMFSKYYDSVLRAVSWRGRQGIHSLDESTYTKDWDIWASEGVVLPADICQCRATSRSGNGKIPRHSLALRRHRRGTEVRLPNTKAEGLPTSPGLALQGFGHFLD